MSLHVLVVDDSAVVRQGFASLLGRVPGVRVSVAADARLVVDRVARLRPDVVVLDLQMPHLDGRAVLRALEATGQRVPVVVCSARAGPGTREALAALEEGAVDVLPKPPLASVEAARAALPGIVQVLSAAAASRRPASPAAVPAPRPATAFPSEAVVLLGASTGGTEALRAILGALPASAPPVVAVQHMPAGFTEAFAERLDGLCAVNVREARAGDVLSAGAALIAPGGRHVRLRRAAHGVVVDLDAGPPVHHQRPSVDVLFTSAAGVLGAAATAALLTGMGSDGADGLLALRRAGAATLAQDEESCVVFGMPRAAVERGAAARVVPLGQMAGALLAAASERRTSAGTPPPRQRPGG